MDILVADFETFFSDDYSLKKMTTEEYVRDPRFKAHMLGYFAPEKMYEPADCLPGLLHTNSTLRARIEQSAVLCHHAYFDGLILSHHFGLKPKLWLDTLSMSRLVLPRLKSHSLEALAAHFGLPPKNMAYASFKNVHDLTSVPGLYETIAEGCQHDVWLTYEIAKRLLPLVPKEELHCIDTIVRLFTEPVLTLDRPRMEAFLKAEKLRKAKAMLAAGAAIGMVDPISVQGVHAYLETVETALQSADKFKTALEALGYPCPMKWSEKQQREIPALAQNDDGMKGLEEHDDGRVSALAAARLGVKSTIDETRAGRLLAAAARGSLPVYLSYAAAKTLRFGGGDKTNWQNFRRGGEIRKSIKAPEGHKLVVADKSQIEYRILCWVAGQTDKLEAMVAGRDLYCEYASQFYNAEITKADKARRGVGKQGILMGGYGAGKGTMIRTAAGGGYGPPVYLSEAEGQQMVDLYRNTHYRVPEFWRWCDSVLPVLAAGGKASYRNCYNATHWREQALLRIEDHKIWFPNDTAIDYTGLRWACNADIFPDQEPDDQGYSWWEPNRKGWARLWGSKLTADIIQGLARVVIVYDLVRIAKRYKVVLQVHDEVVAVVPDAQAEEAYAFMIATMRDPPPWCADLPLEAEGGVAQNYDK